MPIAKIDLPKHVQPASISHNVVAKNDRHLLSDLTNCTRSIVLDFDPGHMLLT